MPSASKICVTMLRYWAYSFIIILHYGILCTKAMESQSICEDYEIKINADFKMLNESADYICVYFHVDNEVQLRGSIIPPLPNLVSLSIDMHHITSIGPMAFTNLPQLKTLTIKTTDHTLPPKPKILEENALKGLNLLEDIYASAVGFKSLHQTALVGAAKLRTVDLSFNLLAELPPNLFQDQSQVILVDFSENKLGTLPPGLFSTLFNLEELMLQENAISYLDNRTFQGLTKLIELDLEKNNLQSIEPGLFASLINLKYLRLNNNFIKALPSNLFDSLTNLESLHLSYNHLKHLPSDIFVNLKELRTLIIDNNRITVIDKQIFQGLYSLVALSMKDNQIAEINNGSFYSLKKLVQLHLDDNQISTVSNAILQGPKHLMILTLQNNNLTSLPGSVIPILNKMMTLEILGNPWSCDSRLQEFGRWLNSMEAQIIVTRQPSCESPLDRQGYYVKQVFLNDSKSLPQGKGEEKTPSSLNSSHRNGIIALCIILAILLVSITVIAMYCKQKHYKLWAPSDKEDGNPGSVRRHHKFVYLHRRKIHSMYKEIDSKHQKTTSPMLNTQVNYENEATIVALSPSTDINSNADFSHQMADVERQKLCNDKDDLEMDEINMQVTTSTNDSIPNNTEHPKERNDEKTSQDVTKEILENQENCERDLSRLSNENEEKVADNISIHSSASKADSNHSFETKDNETSSVCMEDKSCSNLSEPNHLENASISSDKDQTMDSSSLHSSNSDSCVKSQGNIWDYPSFTEDEAPIVLV